MDDTTQMTRTEIVDLFNQTYKGDKNFMTPRVVRYGEKQGFVYELSKGDWMGEDIFGVTVLTAKGEKTEGANGCYDSLEEAEEAIKTIHKIATVEAI